MLKSILFILCLAAMASTQSPIIVFSDSPDGNQLVDASWGYRKTPSLLELAGNNDKFPVETGIVFQGAHSLRLHWTSKTSGDWGIAIASTGWQPMDLTQYDSLVYQINAQQAVPKDALPDIAMEDMASRKSSRAALADFSGDIDGDVATWQRVAVPLTVFAGTSSKADFSQIKTLFHYQKAADDVDHTLYLDDIRFIKETGPVTPPDPPQGLTATGYDSRIDLHWQPSNSPQLAGYAIYTYSSEEGPVRRLNAVAHEPVCYSDFFGANDEKRFYYVTAININGIQSAQSNVVSAVSHAMTDEELLTSVQESAFRYFYDYAHPVSRMARERRGSGETCTSGGTGFGLMNVPVAVERGFISREAAAQHVLTMCRFLRDKAERYHGAWSHWLNGETGKIIPFSKYDDGADLVETAYLVEGLLTVRQYFNGDSADEQEICQICTQLWQEVDWDWFRKESKEPVLYWHWSPNYAWQMNMPIRGFNECMIVYILAIASPTHPVPKSLYYSGWAGNSNYANGKEYYGIKQYVGPANGGPLFFTHYSFLGLDPHQFTDSYCNYFDNNRNISLIHYAYCYDNPKNYPCYGDGVWGLTASDNPWGYSAQEPNNDNGTITPTAAVSAMPYTPDESLAAIKTFYHSYGERLWGEFGFKDAFNCSEDWFAESVLAIDQGPMAPMIENYRTGLIWHLFMSIPEIQQAVDKIMSGVDAPPQPPDSRGLLPNYPNPFNPQTMLAFSLQRDSTVSLKIFNLRGECVATIYNRKYLQAGEHHVEFSAESLPAGVYLCRLNAGDLSEVRKITCLK
jgi:exo beta-1,2-glucooligosaccharide sophorohydrolase (non-reducing end)